VDKDVRRAWVISLIDASPLDKRDPKDLLPYAQNSRTHSDYQIKQIADSIMEFGFMNPVIIDDKDEVMAGHGRIFAAMRLDLPKVTVIRYDHLKPAQQRAYVIADNKIQLNAGWDHDILKSELKELDNLEFDLDVIGFSETELGALMGTLTPPEDEPEEEKAPKIKLCPNCGFETQWKAD
jgi:ParB family transcriptional regulator, chromosome partitioning protein